MLWQRKTAYIEDIEDWVDEPDGSWTYEGYDFNAYIIPEKSGEYEFNVEVWFDLQGNDYSRVMTQRVSGAFEDAVFVASDIVEELFDSGVVKGGSRVAGGRESGGMTGRFYKRSSWSDFNNPVADEMNELYLPSYGEGETMANQIATAVNKLVYKWFNDGDVFDNVHTGLEGWANDLSSYANWLYTYVDFAQIELHPALGELSESEYESILYGLFEVTLCDESFMENYSEQPAVGSVYNCSGPFGWDDSYGEDEDDWYDDDEDY